jgi:hypothetical protein
MSKKEQQELLDESYKDYFIKKSSETGPFGVAGIIPTKEEFIYDCKTDLEFSEKWGLKIEERELNYEERIKLFKEKTNRSLTYTLNVRERLDENGIPTKLIKITYNDKTIESYE